MQPEIDETDIIVLKQLLCDGRKSFTQIAREHNTTKDVIANHYKQMRKKKIIVGSTIQTSCSLYGFNIAAIFSIHVQPPTSEENIPLVAKIPSIGVVLPLGTTSTLLAVAQVKDTAALEKCQNSIRRLPFVIGVDTRIVTGTRSTPENLSILGTKTCDKQSTDSQKSTENVAITDVIDEIDRIIAEKLATCGRTPFSKIAKELNVSTDTIVRHYERLKREGHIKAVIQIDPAKIGYHAYAIFHIAFSHENMEATTDFLKRLQDINVLLKSTGKFDILAIFMIKNIDHFTDLQEKITKLSGFINMEVEIMKMLTVWPPPKELISTF